MNISSQKEGFYEYGYCKEPEMVLYRTEDDNVTVSALIKHETIWLTQKAMAELFGIDKSGISRHLAKIFERRISNPPLQVCRALSGG